MHQKDRAMQAFEAAGLLRAPDAKLKQFLQKIHASSTDCWPELVAECRERHPELRDALATALWKAGDKLLRLNMIRLLDVEDADERAILDRTVQRANAATDLPELKAIVQRGQPELSRRVAAKKGIPRQLADQAERSAGMTPRTEEGEAPKGGKGRRGKKG